MTRLADLERLLARVEPELALARPLVGPVALETSLGEDGADGMPDRFVYTLDYEPEDVDNVHLTLPEQGLTPELSRVVEIVLEHGRGGSGAGPG